MIKADLQIHSKYSSHALYMPYKNIMKKLKSKYPESSFFEGKVWWIEYLGIDGSSDPEKILEIARMKGLKAIAITDHNTFLGSIEAQRLSKKYNIVVIPAEEISTTEGEILAYGITEKIPFRITPQEAIKKIHSQGGLAAISHPFLKPHPKKDFAAISEHLILDLDIDAVEVFSPIKGFQKYWSDFALKNNLAELGGSDAHMDSLIGSVWTESPDECKTTNDFLEAIKARKTKAGGIEKRKLLLLRAGFEYLWKNTFGRPFIKY